jgi:hypothetical protein
MTAFSVKAVAVRAERSRHAGYDIRKGGISLIKYGGFQRKTQVFISTASFSWSNEGVPCDP